MDHFSDWYVHMLLVYCHAYLFSNYIIDVSLYTDYSNLRYRRDILLILTPAIHGLNHTNIAFLGKHHVKTDFCLDNIFVHGVLYKILSLMINGVR